MSFKLVSFFYMYICCFTAEGRGMRTGQQCLSSILSQKSVSVSVCNGTLQKSRLIVAPIV